MEPQGVSDSDGSSRAPIGLTRGRVLGLLAGVVFVAVVLLPQVGRGQGAGRLSLPDGEVLTIEPPEFRAPRLSGDGATEAEAWGRVEATWAANDWNAAHDALADVLEADPESWEAARYAGIALLMRGRFDEAVERLELARALQEQQPGGADSTVHYYLALGRIGRGQASMARRVLEAGRDLGGPDGERAAALLVRLGD